MLRQHLLAVSWGLLLVPLSAQTPAPAPAAPKGQRTEQQVDQEIARILVGYAKTAESCKAHGEARNIYNQILDHYDLEHAVARAGLGWQKVRGEWQQTVAETALPKDTATAAQKKSLTAPWDAARKRIGALHRDLGLQLLAQDQRSRGLAQLERALVFLPEDGTAHEALGHEEFEGFRGTAEQIEFIKRLRALFALGKRIREQPVEVKPVDASQLPDALRRTGIAFAGARTESLTYWVAGSQEEADVCAIASRRAELLWRELLATDPSHTQLKLWPTKWVAVVRSAEQRRRLLETSPECRDNDTLDRALLKGGNTFVVPGGRAEWVINYEPKEDADSAVGQWTKRAHGAMNSPLTEGMVHLATWLLCDSMMSSYMQLAHTGGKDEEEPTAPADWFRLLRAEIDAGADWPLVQVPREGLQNFRASVRFKSWSFVTWLIARHPDRWVQLLASLPSKNLSEEVVEQTFQSVLERGTGEVDAEWRAFARRGSRIGKAAGLPQ
ncbi:MAG: hypothetical protein MUC36_27350 [Planctomycetes bacterium]|nr:hypothetical protein [Planctomycetota bacterium]